jgi:hypothetical protein
MYDIDLMKSLFGTPTVLVYIHNIRVEPVADGSLRLVLSEELPHHAKAWETLERVLEQDLVLEVMQGDQLMKYIYVPLLGEDGVIYLHQANDDEDAQWPPDEIFLRRAVNLWLPNW